MASPRPTLKAMCSELTRRLWADQKRGAAKIAEATHGDIKLAQQRIDDLEAARDYLASVIALEEENELRKARETTKPLFDLEERA